MSCDVPTILRQIIELGQLHMSRRFFNWVCFQTLAAMLKGVLGIATDAIVPNRLSQVMSYHMTLESDGRTVGLVSMYRLDAL